MLESKYRETLTPKDSNNQRYQSSQPNLQLQGRHKGLGADHTLSTRTRGYGRGTQEGSTSQNEPFLPWWLRYTPWASAWPKALNSDWRSRSDLISTSSDGGTNGNDDDDGHNQCRPKYACTSVEINLSVT
jgi:hypothetical protein